MAKLTSTDRIGRRRILGAALVAATCGPVALAHARTALSGEVWKDPSCGCCQEWVKHLQDNGITLKVHDIGNNGVRAQLGIDRKYGSCHTAVIGGYAFEGHVPAADIHRLLREKPTALGLAVPGMPVGSPGMDGPIYEGRKDPFTVLLLSRDGTSKDYQRYQGKKS